MTATASEKPKTDTLHGPNLILDVENFGPIAEAKNIEFKPMTVFVGPSNTGKTYLGKALHAFTVAINTELQDFVGSDPFQNSFNYATKHSDVAYLGSNLISSKDTILECPTDKKGYFLVPVTLLARTSHHFIRDVLRELKENIDNRVRETFLDFFDVPYMSRLIYQQSHLSLYPKVDLYIDYDEENDPTSVSLMDEDSSSDLHLDTILMSQSFVDSLDHRSGIPAERFSELIAEQFDVLLRFSVSRLFADGPRSHYLPSDRSGLMNTITLLPEDFDLDNLRSTYRIGKEYMKLINAAIHGRAVNGSIDRVPFTRGHMLDHPLSAEVVNNIRDAMIAGNLIRYSHGNLMDPQALNAIRLEYKSEDATTPLTASASMINQIAPMLLFIERYVYQGDMLIIDEPESHLHPAAQQQMAAVLAYLIRSGIRVLITTHSHYMVEQLSAFVNASKLDETTRKRALSLGGALGEEDIYLNEDETAVYGFDESNADDGTVVYEIPLGEHREYAPRDHSKAVNRQYNRLQRVLEARERLGV